MKWIQDDIETFARYYGGPLRVLDEYLPRREIETEILLRLISDAKKEISEIEEELHKITD